MSKLKAQRGKVTFLRSHSNVNLLLVKDVVNQDRLLEVVSCLFIRKQ